MSAPFYPETPGFRRGAPDTSRKAAMGFTEEAKSIRARVHALIAAAGPDGLTGCELGAAMDMHPHGVRSRVSELRAGKSVADSGKRRMQRSGRPGAVWVLSQYAAEDACEPEGSARTHDGTA